MVRERFKGIGVTVPAPERRTPEYLAKFVASRDRALGRPDQGERAQRGLTREAAMLRTIAALALVLACADAVRAQDWPTRTVTMVVPFAAGGPIDVVARILAPRMSESLGQQIIVENVGGAGGIDRLVPRRQGGARRLPVPARQQRHPCLQPDAVQEAALQCRADFAPVAVFVENSKVLTTRKDFPADTLPEFVAYAKANQAKMQFGSAGVGSATHMTCVLLNTRIGIDLTHVPYRS